MLASVRSTLAREPNPGAAGSVGPLCPHYPRRVIPERFAPLVGASTELASRFEKAGHTLYLVGGSVRDAFVIRPGDEREAGVPGTDLDFTTDAVPDEIEGILRGWADAVWTQGKRWGTVGATKAGRRLEITTHRAEAYSPDSRKPEVAFGDSIELDLSRRDFTVNSMALRAARPRADRPLRTGSATWRASPAAHPARPGGLLRRRPPAHAPRRPASIAGSGSRARAEARRGRGADARPPRHRLRRAHPRRARQDRRGATCRRWRLWFVVRDRAGRRVPPRAARRSPSSRTRSTGTRTCWRTPWPWWTRRRRTGCSAWPRCSTTSASRGPVPSRTAG